VGPLTHGLPRIESARGQIPLVTAEVFVGEHRFELLHPRSVDELIDEEDFDRDERLPYWAELWPSGRVLANRIVQENTQEQCRPRQLLELGCGIGLASLVAARIGFAVTATDYYEAAIELLRVNARRNAVEGVTARLLDWRSFPEDLGQFDIVAASDVLYERPNVPLVANAFARSLGAAGLGLVTDPSRRSAESFPEECQRRGLTCVYVARVPMVDGTSRPTIDLYEVRRE
jgi:predicted nicotinamide N-methyase